MFPSKVSQYIDTLFQLSEVQQVDRAQSDEAELNQYETELAIIEKTINETHDHIFSMTPLDTATSKIKDSSYENILQIIDTTNHKYLKIQGDTLIALKKKVTLLSQKLNKKYDELHITPQGALLTRIRKVTSIHIKVFFLKIKAKHLSNLARSPIFHQAKKIEYLTVYILKQQYKELRKDALESLEPHIVANVKTIQSTYNTIADGTQKEYLQKIVARSFIRLYEIFDYLHNTRNISLQNALSTLKQAIPEDMIQDNVSEKKDINTPDEEHDIEYINCTTDEFMNRRPQYSGLWKKATHFTNWLSGYAEWEKATSYLEDYNNYQKTTRMCLINAYIDTLFNSEKDGSKPHSIMRSNMNDLVIKDIFTKLKQYEWFYLSSLYTTHAINDSLAEEVGTVRALTSDDDQVDQFQLFIQDLFQSIKTYMKEKDSSKLFITAYNLFNQYENTIGDENYLFYDKYNHILHSLLKCLTKIMQIDSDSLQQNGTEYMQVVNYGLGKTALNESRPFLIKALVSSTIFQRDKFTFYFYLAIARLNLELNKIEDKTDREFLLSMISEYKKQYPLLKPISLSDICTCVEALNRLDAASNTQDDLVNLNNGTALAVQTLHNKENPLAPAVIQFLEHQYQKILTKKQLTDARKAVIN